MKKLLVLAMSLLMIFALAGCGSDEGGEEEKKTSFAIGETADINGVKYTVNDVQYSEGNDWSTPEEGKEFVIISVTIENGSEEDVSYNFLDWTMVNSQGQEDDTSFSLVDTDTNIGSGDLTPGGTKTGTVVFEEPKGDESLKLLHYENVLLDDEPDFEVVIK